MTQQVFLKFQRQISFLIAISISLLHFALFLRAFLMDNWGPLGVPGMNPKFGDLKSVTSAVDCMESLQYIDVYQSNCDYWQRPFNYPPVWVDIFRFMQLNTDSVTAVGMALAVSTSILLGCWALYTLRRAYSIFSFLFLMIFSLSPSIFLLDERGNVDSVIFLFLSIIIHLFLRNRIKFSLIITTFAGILKVYPLFLFGSFFLICNKVSTRVYILLLLTVSLLYLAPFARIILQNTPRTHDYSFGFVYVLDAYFANDSTLLNVVKVSFGLFIIIFYVLIKKLGLPLGNYLNWKSQDLESERILLLSFPMFFLIYLAGSSFNYRIILLLPTLASLVVVNSKVGRSVVLLYLPYIFLAMRLNAYSFILDIFLFLGIFCTSIIWLHSANNLVAMKKQRLV
jgi:hypothetical protein